MKFRGVLAVLALGVVLVAFLLWRVGGEVKERYARQRANPLASHSATAAIQINPASASSPANSASTTSPNEPAPDPEFQKWIANEARAVDSMHVDSEAKRTELTKVIAGITKAQTQQLLQTARNTGAPAGERILATYLLAEARARELSTLITSPLPDFAGTPAHSEAETRAGQERSLRVMAIDSLVARAPSDPAALATLTATLEKVVDPSIRSYIQKKLTELSSH